MQVPGTLGGSSGVLETVICRRQERESYQSLALYLEMLSLLVALGYGFSLSVLRWSGVRSRGTFSSPSHCKFEYILSYASGVILGRETSVSRWITFIEEQLLGELIWDIHSHQRMIPIILTLTILRLFSPPWGWHLWVFFFFVKYIQSYLIQSHYAISCSTIIRSNLSHIWPNTCKASWGLAFCLYQPTRNVARLCSHLMQWPNHVITTLCYVNWPHWVSWWEKWLQHFF